MSHTHQSLGSPLPERPESFGPLSRNNRPTTAEEHFQNQNPAHPEGLVSPLGTEFPDSPTLGYLSPVSIMSPDLSFSPEPLHFNQSPAADSESRFPPPVSEVPQTAAAAALEVPQTVHLARGGTVHMQDLIPFKSAKTRFPPRKALVSLSQTPADDEAGARRPITMYLADYKPHLVALAPTAPIQRPHYRNGVSLHEGRAEEDVGAEFQDIELQGPSSLGDHGGFHTQNLHVRKPMNEDRGVEGRGRTRAEVEARKRNCVIGWVFIFALVVAIAVFAGLVSLANKPGGVAG